MNYSASGTFKRGLATNVDQGVSADIAGLKGSTVIYTGTAEDYGLDASGAPQGKTALDGVVIAYYLTLGGVSAYRLSGITEITGSPRRDLIDLTNAANPYTLDVFIDGGGGNDTIWSGQGDDLLYGRTGSDSIWGGNGDDIIDGGDRYSEGYDDNLDSLYGGAGSDTIYGSNGDTIDGGAEDDIINVRSASEDGILEGSINGGAGYDEFQWNGDLGLSAYPSTALSGVERIHLNFGVIFAADPDTAVNFDFTGVDFLDVWGVYGSDAGDVIEGPKSVSYGSEGESGLVILCLSGNDTINGGPEYEDIYGEAGEDLVRGGAGNDSIYGNDGYEEEGPADPAPDDFYGEAGADWFIFWREFGDYETIYDFERGTDTIALYNYYYEGEEYYYYEGVELSFDLLEELELITQYDSEFVQIDLTDFGGSILLVNGTVGQFAAEDFEIGSIG